MRLEMIEDEFDKYFALAAQVKEIEITPPTTHDAYDEESDLRRGSLPTSRLKTPELNIVSSPRRTASCKYPSNQLRERSTRCVSRSPDTRPKSINLDNAGLTNGSYIHENSLRAPSPGPGVQCHSAPHSRSSSFKKGRRNRRAGSGDSTPEARPRTGSAPLEDTVTAQLERIKYLQAEDCCPVRNFSLSSKGLINRGDSFKRKSICNVASDSNDSSMTYEPASHSRPGSQQSQHSDTTPSFKVLVLGDHGVGKTALLQQFLTSEYMGASTGHEEDDEDAETTVSVLLDGDETTMDFTDVAYEENFRNYGEVDAYVIVFSLADRNSFLRAVDLVREVHRSYGGQAGIILVANKSDVVRCRQVNEDEARVSCVECSAKYIELSAALNHKVDELLVGIARQIRLNPKRQARAKKLQGVLGKQRHESIIVKASKGLMDKIMRNKHQVSRSCDNLQVL